MKLNLYLTGHVCPRPKENRSSNKRIGQTGRKKRNRGVVLFSAYRSNTIRNTYSVVYCALTSAFLLLDRATAADGRHLGPLVFGNKDR